MIDIRHSMGIAVLALLVGLLVGFIAAADYDKATIKKLEEDGRAYRTPARHNDRHGNYRVLDASRHLLVCKDCAVVFCADEKGIVADWAKMTDGKPLGWSDY